MQWKKKTLGKYQIFLGKGALPLATPKSYSSASLEQIGPKIMHIYHAKFSCPLATPESYISVNLDQKGPEIMHIYSSQNTGQIFLGKGALPPCNPQII